MTYGNICKAAVFNTFQIKNSCSLREIYYILKYFSLSHSNVKSWLNLAFCFDVDSTSRAYKQKANLRHDKSALEQDAGLSTQLNKAEVDKRSQDGQDEDDERNEVCTVECHIIK